ncbi:methyltransferase [Spirochaetia bacterium]|nr:methyltransferase [Spirochaetia bacterium]
MMHTEIRKWTGEYATKAWTLYCGDSATVLKGIESASINCIITSPPYYSLRDYKIEGQIGLENSVEEYVAALCNVFDEAYRVLKKDGLFFLNIGDTYYSGKGKSHGIDPKSTKRRFGLRPVDKSGGLGINLQRKSIIGIPWRVAIEMMTRKWVLRTPIIWHRDKALPESVKDRPRRSYEYVFMFAKDKKYYFNRHPLIAKEFDEDVWTIVARPKANGGIQTAPYPDELVERCLEIGCPSNGSVLDPFAGSGTTLRVALQSGRNAVGIDLSPDFCHYILSELQEKESN